MHLNYYTFKALAACWDAKIRNCHIGDIYSQSRNELSLVVARSEGSDTIKVSTDPSIRFVFHQPGTGRRRRNVADVFVEAHGMAVDRVRAADRDRFLFFDLAEGLTLQVQLFGPRPNVFLVRDGTVLRAFSRGDAWQGKPAPVSRPAPPVSSYESFAKRWDASRKSVDAALSRAIPLFDTWMAREAAFRADVPDEEPGSLDEARLRRLFRCAQEVEAECRRPRPRIYQRSPHPSVFSLTRLSYLHNASEETFDDVDAAMNRYIRRMLAERRFDAEYTPLERAVRRVTERYAARAERAREELHQEGRDRQYERWGHLLMARPADPGLRADEVTVPDVLSKGEPVRIPLDESLSVIENAQAYYDKARKTRQARKHAQDRVEEMEKIAHIGGELLDELESVESLEQLKSFQERHGHALKRFTEEAGGGPEASPFRRIPIDHEYEVWVGRNARQNDVLTFHLSAKHDYWMHARGLPGSHVILKRSDKSKKPPRQVLERAAAIAAWFSEARNSALVPVIVAERKYVRKPKGSPPGLVKVDREDVILVAPRQPVS